MRKPKRRLYALVLVMLLALGMLTACGGNSDDSVAPSPTTENTPQETPNAQQETVQPPQTNDETKADFSTMEGIEAAATNDVEMVVATLTAEYGEIESAVNSYNTYVENADVVKAFYETVLTAQKELNIRMREYALAYAQVIISTEAEHYDTNDMYDDLEVLYDVLYEDLGDDIYDEIYDGILDDAHDLLYEDALDDSDAAPSYSEWSDTRSNEYDWWSDCRSDVYDDWSDCRSDIYDFWSDVRSEIYDEDIEKAQGKIDKFQTDIDKLKGIDTGSSREEVNTDINLSEVTSLEEVAALAKSDVENILVALTAEYETLKAGVVSFDTYVENIDAVESFYEKVFATQETLTVILRGYASIYTEMILKSGNSCDDMYEAMDDTSDIFYDDLGDAINDGFYDGILEDMKNDFYEDVLDDSDAASSYSEWYDIRSNEYNCWYDIRSAVYEDWYDFRSDIYEFCYDIRGELWNDDLEGALKELSDFQEDFLIMAGMHPTSGSNATAEDNLELIDGMRPEFKEAMDAYEAFYTEYCDFMAEYSENPTDLKLLAKYSEMLIKVEEMNEAFEAWDEDELNNEELKYYLDVNNRVMKMLLDVAG